MHHYNSVKCQLPTYTKYSGPSFERPHLNLNKSGLPQEEGGAMGGACNMGHINDCILYIIFKK